MATRQASTARQAMENAAKVLVIDDEVEIVDLMRDFLEAAGFQVVTANRGEDALAMLGQTAVDCVLLDVMMPGMSGFEVLREIREQGNVPVLILSARDADADKLRGLGLGADDYIVKSATPAEVVARVRTVLRRSGQTAIASSLLDFGRLVIDLTAREVRVNGESVSLTPREFDLLHMLASHPRRAFSRDELHERLWGNYGDPHTVTVHMARVREKIEVDPSRPRHLVTVRGMGYRFEGERP